MNKYEPELENPDGWPVREEPKPVFAKTVRYSNRKPKRVEESVQAKPRIQVSVRAVLIAIVLLFAVAGFFWCVERTASFLAITPVEQSYFM